MKDRLQVFLEFMIFTFAGYDDRYSRYGFLGGLGLQGGLDVMVISHSFNGPQDPLEYKEDGQNKKEEEGKGKQSRTSLLEFSLECRCSVGIIIARNARFNGNTLRATIRRGQSLIFF